MTGYIYKDSLQRSMILFTSFCLRRGLFVNSDKKYAKTSFETDGFKASLTLKSLACYGT